MADPAEGAKPKKLHQHLYAQVLTAIVIGVVIGHFFPETGAAMKPFGDGFIKLIKMLIAPIIFCTVVLGIAGMENLKEVGRIGLKALLYFEGVSTLSLIVGLIVVNVWRPGAGMNVDPATLDTHALSAMTAKAPPHDMVEFLLNIIPTTMVDAFAAGEILQVLLIAVLFGFALFALRERGRVLLEVIEQVSQVLFGIVGIIMRVAPLGAFGAMAFTVGKYGVASLLPLANLMAAFYTTCLLFIFVVLGSIAWAAGFNILRFIGYIKEELLIVLGTSSSESVLPRMMAKLQNLGVERQVVGLVIPTGYSFNLDGTAIYLTIAAVFVAQALNIPLTLGHEITLLLVLLLTSKGAAGVTGSGFITLAATLSSVSTIPVAGLALILGVDRFMSEARALTNLVGNGVATVVIGRWENAVDVEVMKSHLGGRSAVEAETPEKVA